MKFTKKHALLISVLAVMMALCTVVGATLAYLFVKTDPVVNTFSPSNIGLTLTETTTNYQMIPGVDIAKDPKVTVTADVDCYVFVKIDKSDNYGTYLEDYGVATGWTLVPGQNDVYYREVTAAAAKNGASFYVLAGNETFANGYVSVKTSVNKAQMAAIATNNQPTLTFTAYAVQKAGFENNIAGAWTQAQAQQ